MVGPQVEPFATPEVDGNMTPVDLARYIEDGDSVVTADMDFDEGEGVLLQGLVGIIPVHVEGTG